MERVKMTLRRMHYSPRTEEAYVGWIVRFLRFTGMKHPLELGVDALREFLNHLANERNVAASSQNQALCAVLFMYKQVLGMPLEVQAFDRAKRPRHLPGVLDAAEVRALLRAMRPPCALIAAVLYGAGMRLHECLGVRVKDVDLVRGVLIIRAGKGGHDRMAILPQRLKPAIVAQLARVSRQHAADLGAGGGYVDLPHALARKVPAAERALSWQYVFPASRPYVDKETGKRVRPHLHETAV
ncbi:MAG TPA: phage integrase N-terminal SAM-like domain-containing protein [Myxococcota bacterium]|nr:phage integrase N-terminal SAM-like domain-containing protein [Myxococcota bacterium]